MTTTNPSVETTATQRAIEERSSVSSPDNRDLIIERIFDAPRELVFKAWIDPEHVAQWWKPTCFTIPLCEMDVRPGGAILLHMAAPDGTVFPMEGVFQEIKEPERLVMVTRAVDDGEGNFLIEATTTVTLAEYGGKTKLTLHVVVTKAAPEAAGALEGMEEGWNQSLDSLSEVLANL